MVFERIRYCAANHKWQHIGLNSAYSPLKGQKIAQALPKPLYGVGMPFVDPVSILIGKIRPSQQTVLCVIPRFRFLSMLDAHRYSKSRQISCEHSNMPELPPWRSASALPAESGHLQDLLIPSPQAGRSTSFQSPFYWRGAAGL